MPRRLTRQEIEEIEKNTPTMGLQPSNSSNLQSVDLPPERGFLNSVMGNRSLGQEPNPLEAIRKAFANDPDQFQAIILQQDPKATFETFDVMTKDDQEFTVLRGSPDWSNLSKQGFEATNDAIVANLSNGQRITFNKPGASWQDAANATSAVGLSLALIGTGRGIKNNVVPKFRSPPTSGVLIPETPPGLGRQITGGAALSAAESVLSDEIANPEGFPNFPRALVSGGIGAAGVPLARGYEYFRSGAADIFRNRPFNNPNKLPKDLSDNPYAEGVDIPNFQLRQQPVETSVARYIQQQTMSNEAAQVLRRLDEQADRAVDKFLSDIKPGEKPTSFDSFHNLLEWSQGARKSVGQSYQTKANEVFEAASQQANKTGVVVDTSWLKQELNNYYLDQRSPVARNFLDTLDHIAKKVLPVRRSNFDSLTGLVDNMEKIIKAGRDSRGNIVSNKNEVAFIQDLKNRLKTQLTESVPLYGEGLKITSAKYNALKEFDQTLIGRLSGKDAADAQRISSIIMEADPTEIASLREAVIKVSPETWDNVQYSVLRKRLDTFIKTQAPGQILPENQSSQAYFALVGRSREEQKAIEALLGEEKTKNLAMIADLLSTTSYGRYTKTTPLEKPVREGGKGGFVYQFIRFFSLLDLTTPAKRVVGENVSQRAAISRDRAIFDKVFGSDMTAIRKLVNQEKWQEAAFLMSQITDNFVSGPAPENQPTGGRPLTEEEKRYLSQTETEKQ